MGTIGGGNHFAELQAVEEIFDAAEFTARDPKYRFYDLTEPDLHPVRKVNLTCGNIKSQVDWDDRKQERRAERERQQKLQGAQ